MTLAQALLCLQAATFIGLGACMFYAGNWKLGLAQEFLAIITWLVYG
jgi:hypothetical protein